MTTTPPEAPLGPPPPDPHGDHGPRVDRDQVRDLGRLRRSRADRKVAGVAGGLGRHLDVDPLVLRVAFVVLVFFGGAGLILYGACWLLVPEDGSEKAAINLDERSRSVVLIVVGVIAALAMIGDSWGGGWFPWPLAVIALVALWLLTRNSPPSGAMPPPAPGAAVPPTSAYVPPTSTYIPPTSAYVPQQPYYTEPVAPFQSYVRPPNPRKKGPILFWFTLALIALGVGVLGIVDVAGADVADSAYPALAVGISGVMLVVGAFFGRAGGIIALGLVASLGLAAATVADKWEGDTIYVTPLTAAEVQGGYDMEAGEIILDLSEVADPENLDGQAIELEGAFGRIEVILPEEGAASITADVDGPGNIKLFGAENGGIGVSRSGTFGAGLPVIVIDAHLSVGEIEVQR
ncbi:PspC domain-containing protein [Nocardioides caricicola]|uniref:PspC domain-containing protein n=1 Tax=Nocardioides caricicola TaxID=634770 RepID=A0ABW0N054_9ACTN